MSREKMLQAEIALKDEQLADLNEAVNRLRRQLDKSEKRAKITDQSESKLAELKQMIGKLAPVAKRAVLFAGELGEARRRLAVVEKERINLSKNYAAAHEQATILKVAVAVAQSDARSFNAERKEAVRRAKKAEAAVKTAARQKLMTIAVASFVCAGTIGGGYAYVRAALDPPAELSEGAAAAFKQYAAEYRLIVELAAQSERDKLVDAERERLVAERHRFQELDENTVWEKLISYGWLALIFGGGFVIGAMTIFAAFIFRMH